MEKLNTKKNSRKIKKKKSACAEVLWEETPRAHPGSPSPRPRRTPWPAASATAGSACNTFKASFIAAFLFPRPQGLLVPRIYGLEAEGWGVRTGPHEGRCRPGLQGAGRGCRDPACARGPSPINVTYLGSFWSRVSSDALQPRDALRETKRHRWPGLWPRRGLRSHKGCENLGCF